MARSLKRVGATNNASYSGIGSTGIVGESALQQLGGTSQYYFSTSLGGRYVDQLVDDVANESKVGYTSLTQSVQLQIAKDTELLQTGNVQGVAWNFLNPEDEFLRGSESLLRPRPIHANALNGGSA